MVGYQGYAFVKGEVVARQQGTSLQAVCRRIVQAITHKKGEVYAIIGRGNSNIPRVVLIAQLLTHIEQTSEPESKIAAGVQLLEMIKAEYERCGLLLEDVMVTAGPVGGPKRRRSARNH